MSGGRANDREDFRFVAPCTPPAPVTHTPHSPSVHARTRTHKCATSILEHIARCRACTDIDRPHTAVRSRARSTRLRESIFIVARASIDDSSASSLLRSSSARVCEWSVHLDAQRSARRSIARRSARLVWIGASHRLALLLPARACVCSHHSVCRSHRVIHPPRIYRCVASTRYPRAPHWCRCRCLGRMHLTAECALLRACAEDAAERGDVRGAHAPHCGGARRARSPRAASTRACMHRARADDRIVHARQSTLTYLHSYCSLAPCSVSRRSSASVSLGRCAALPLSLSASPRSPWPPAR
jgi:hypothetical protein